MKTLHHQNLERERERERDTHTHTHTHTPKKRLQRKKDVQPSRRRRILTSKNPSFLVDAGLEFLLARCIEAELDGGKKCIMKV
jgi:hypothetical protein